MQTTMIRVAILALSLAALTSGAQAQRLVEYQPKLMTSEFYDLAHKQDEVGPNWDGVARIQEQQSIVVQPQHVPQLDPEFAGTLMGN